MFFDAYCQIAAISLHQKLKRTKICQPQNSSSSATVFPKSSPQTATSPKRPPASAAAFPVTPSPSSLNSASRLPSAFPGRRSPAARRVLPPTHRSCRRVPPAARLASTGGVASSSYNAL